MAGDVRMYGLDEPLKPAVYLPYAQRPTPRLALIIRTAHDPAVLSEPVRKAVTEVDSEQAVSEPTTMAQRLSSVMAPRRLSTALLGVFAGLALLLAIVGIYGLTSYQVSQRTNEFGLRMALGAGRRDLFRRVVGKGVSIALIGVVIGLAGAIALSRLMSGLLYGVSATDPIVFALVSFLLVAVTALASYVPAHRATKVDPIVALRYE